MVDVIEFLGFELKCIMWMGIVVIIDNCNWELCEILGFV